VFVAAAFTLARSAGGTLHRVRLCGLLLGTWMLLMLRAVLALRYVFPPAPVDQLAVKGILFSFWPLLLLPLALAALAVGQLEANLGAARKSLRLRAMLVAVGALGAVGLMRLPSSLWRPLPERLVGPTAWYTLALAGLAFLLLAWIAVPGRARSVVAKVMERWQRRSATLRPPSARWRDSFSNFPRSGKSIVAVFVATFVVVKLFQLVGSAKSEVFLRDIGIHGLWLWFPAILWLGGLAWLQGERRMVWPLVWTVIIAALVTPFVADDPGSVVSAGAVFLALALILFHYRKAVWASLTITAVLAVGLAVALAFYVNIEGLFSAVKFAGNAPKYVLVYKHGPASTSDILGQSANLANAYQHNWENQAMVARGGVLGAGYGEAPARRSWVRQDTLQYDSVYAFFIAGDHGLLGGASLLGLYLGLLVLASRGRHAQSGLGAIAQLVYLAMALEAFVHAGMNVGLLPFAGRDLPLLAVASITDVMKWSLLVALAFVGDLSDTSEPGRAVRRPVFRSIYVLTAAFALACLGVQAARIASSRWKEFSWQPLLAEARQYIERGEIRLDAAGNIAPFTGRAGNLREESLLAIERERFQLATPSQRLGAEHATDLTARLYKVGTSAELNRALASAVSDTGEPASRPLLFRLEEPRRFADLGGALRVTAPAGGGVLGVNPLYDTKLSFERDATTGELPTLRFHDRLPQWEFRGNGFTIELPARPRDRFEQRLVTLRRTSKGGMRIVADSNPGAGNVTVQVDVDGQQRIAALGASGTTRKPVLALDYANGKPVVANVRQGMTWEIQRREGNGGSVQPTIEPFRGIAFLEVGDVLRPAQDELAQLLSMHVLQRDAGVVVGPAWVMGRQVSVVDPESEVPWLSVFGSLAGSPATVVGNYLRGKSEELTLDRSLQQMAQELVRAKGDELHRQRLARAAYYRNRLRTTHAYKAYPQRTQIAFVSERVLPPRVGLTILGLPGGEVAAMGSWPRADFASLVNRPVPEMIAALDRVAPAYVKARYGGDRNFDRLEVGSATKPLIAGAALLLQPELDRQLCVKWNGAAAPESEVFGIPIRGTPWGLGHIDYPGGPVDFRTYLQESSNLYQIRLGFLALAERDAAGNAQSFPGSPSEREAMTGCAPWRPWRRYPRFPAGLGFSPSAPDTLQALYDSDLAIQLRNRYGVGVRWQETRQVRESFWSAQAEDDFRSPVQAVEDLQQRSEVPALFGAISPETTNLELDDVDRPRELVSFLLGGSTNRWSNLDLAAAFATAVSGQQVRAHVLAVAVGGRPAFQPFPATSARLRPGLQAVWTDGTAKRLATVGQRLRAEGVAMYVKTGTAETESRDPFNDAPPTSRVLVALIRWGDEAAGRVERGVVLSLFAERAGEGTATRWMEEFLSNPRTMERLLRVLKPPTAGGPPPGVGP
jgi:cell division protein FtsI/penicillin-binding protein 2/cell division protein FtsW (lipid II flippase)